MATRKSKMGDLAAAMKSSQSSSSMPQQTQQPVQYAQYAQRQTASSQSSPYSLDALFQFFLNNAGLIFIGLSIFIVGFIAGSLWTENQMLKKGLVPSGSTNTQPAAAQQQQAAGQNQGPATLSDADWQSALDKPAFVIGNKDAKVTMVEFTDYQCPFCGQFFTQSYAQLKKDYIDTGKMKLVIHDQPLPFHPNSRVGALAARCAGDQGKYEEMHNQLFGNQNDWVNLSNTDATNKFGDYATKLGINGSQLISCVKTEKFGKEVDADIALANKVGANGTPTFFIEKEPIVGAQPTNIFTAALDKALTGK